VRDGRVGSGKSTLIEDVLYPALLKYRGKPTEAPGEFAGLAGAELIDDVLMVDQNPIGPPPLESCQLYRRLRCDSGTVRRRAGGAGSASTAPELSASTPARPLPGLHGNGFEHVEMQFLSDVYLRCPDCDGRRLSR